MPKELSLAQAQQQAKPKIEDAILELLDGDNQQNALNFVAYLRTNKLTPRWTATNAWGVKYKGKNLISIRINGNAEPKVYYGLEHGAWHIGHWYLNEWLLNNPTEFEDLSNCDKFKAFIWANLYPCKHCLSCKPGHSRTYFGKRFESVCAFRVENPNADGLEFAKKLLECKKEFISNRK